MRNPSAVFALLVVLSSIPFASSCDSESAKTTIGFHPETVAATPAISMREGTSEGGDGDVVIELVGHELSDVSIIGFTVNFTSDVLRFLDFEIGADFESEFGALDFELLENGVVQVFIQQIDPDSGFDFDEKVIGELKFELLDDAAATLEFDTSASGAVDPSGDDLGVHWYGAEIH